MLCGAAAAHTHGEAVAALAAVVVVPIELEPIPEGAAPLSTTEAQALQTQIDTLQAALTNAQSNQSALVTSLVGVGDRTTAVEQATADLEEASRLPEPGVERPTGNTFNGQPEYEYFDTSERFGALADGTHLAPTEMPVMTGITDVKTMVVNFYVLDTAINRRYWVPAPYTFGAYTITWQIDDGGVLLLQDVDPQLRVEKWRLWGIYTKAA